MAYFPFQPGQQPMSSSQGVVIASNQSPVSVTGTVTLFGIPSISGQVGASVIGLTPVSVSNFPTTQNVSGSIVGFQGTSPWVINGSVSGTIGASVIGNVPVVVQSSVATVIIGGSIAASFTPPANQSVSGTVGASIVGQLPAGTAVLGSVAALQGTNPWVVTGSVIGAAYVERNDTVASFLGADLTIRPQASDSAGRTVTKPFAPDEARLDSVSSVVSTSVTGVFNSVTGLRNYVTDIMIANTGAAATLVTFKDGSTSILGYTIAPAGGGSNIIAMAFPMRTAPGQDFVYQAATATSVLYATFKGYKAP